MTDRWTTYFMDIAERTAKLSYANKLKVGVVAVANRRIVLCGFNGTPENHDNVCEYRVYGTGLDCCIQDENGDSYRLETKNEVLHAEENLILYASKQGIPLKGCEIYITHQPCLNCARMIYGAGFVKVVYKQDYRSNDGLDFLTKVGLDVQKYGGYDNE